MGNKVYVGDVGTAIVVDCGYDISEATDTSLKVRLPDGTSVTWAAEIHAIDGETRYLRYVTKAGDFQAAGNYRLQASLTLNGWSGLGETASFTVYSAYA